MAVCHNALAFAGDGDPAAQSSALPAAYAVWIRTMPDSTSIEIATKNAAGEFLPVSAAQLSSSSPGEFGARISHAKQAAGDMVIAHAAGRAGASVHDFTVADGVLTSEDIRIPIMFWASC